MSAPAVSIVVPVYNTGSFLPRCLASLERQTFQDKEVILVDDGSTDGSAALCDAFAQRHPWARVVRPVRTEGLSAARNDGVAATIGEFIGFVDSDDWIAPTMFETLHRVATETESDVAQIQYVLCSGERQVDNPNECVRTLTAEEALAEMLFDERYAVWNRLYRRSLFDACGPECFPVGKTCEDRVANFKLLPNAKQVAVSNRIEYFYFQNIGSISNGGLDRRGLDLIEADRLMVELARALGSDRVLKLAEDRAAKSSFSLLVKWARFGVVDPALDEDGTVTRLFDDFEKNYRRLMESPLSFGKRAVAWQLRHCPSLVRYEFKAYDTLSRLGRKGDS